MDTLYKPTPRPVFQGFRDSSREQLSPVAEQFPTHLPHLFGFAERGSFGAKLGGGDALKNIFGTKTFLATSEFANHQTMLAAGLMGRQNIFFERLPAPGSSTAMLRIAVEVIADEIPDYERDLETGKYRLDENGDPIEQGTVIGHRVRWMANPVSMESEEFGQAQQMAGTLVSSLADEESTIYPIFDLPVSSPGAWGDGIGVRFGSPTTGGANPADGALMRSIRSYIHSIQIVEQSTTSTPTVLATRGGDLSVSVCLKPNTLHPRLDTEMSMQDTLVPSYRLVGEPGVPDTEGPFEDLHVYTGDFEALLGRLISGAGITAPTDFQGEEEFDDGNIAGSVWRRTGAEALADEQNQYMLNPFTGRDLNGVPYFSFVLTDGSEAGEVISASSVQYAEGGSDGDISPKAFDEAVRQHLLNYGSFSQESNANNMGLYPWSDYYDTGFSLDTKYAFADVINVRPDIKTWISTQEVWAPDPEDSEAPYVQMPQNDITTENAMASLLSSHIRTNPESVIYGTPTCRAFLVNQSGYIYNSPFKGLVPLTYELALMRSNYMGAGTGIWARGQSPQIDPNNRITLLRGLNHPFRTNEAYDQAWDAGAIWAQTYNRSSNFIPAWRSIYLHSDSVLLSASFVDACVEATKAHFRVWRQLVGRDDLTDIEFQEESDRLLSEDLRRSRFDDKFIFRPVTEVSEDDSARGWSWRSTVRVYGNKMKLVGVFTVDGRNMSELEV